MVAYDTVIYYIVGVSVLGFGLMFGSAVVFYSFYPLKNPSCYNENSMSNSLDRRTT